MERSLMDKENPDVYRAMKNDVNDEILDLSL